MNLKIKKKNNLIWIKFKIIELIDEINRYRWQDNSIERFPWLTIKRLDNVFNQQSCPF